MSVSCQRVHVLKWVASLERFMPFRQPVKVGYCYIVCCIIFFHLTNKLLACSEWLESIIIIIIYIIMLH